RFLYPASAVVEITRPNRTPAAPTPCCSSSAPRPPTGSSSPPATRAATSRRTPSISTTSEAGRYRSHGNRLSKRRVHAPACFERRAATPERMPTDFRAALSRSLPRPRSRHFPLTSNSAVVASPVTSTAQRSPWPYGPAIVFGLRRHLSRKSFAFLTQTGGPSCREALGREATSSSKRNKASFPTRSN